MGTIDLIDRKTNGNGFNGNGLLTALLCNPLPSGLRRSLCRLFIRKQKINRRLRVLRANSLNSTV